MPISSFFNQSNYFSSYIDIKAISAPSNPHSGVGRIFYNTSDSKLYLKKSDGTLVDLTGSGGSSTFAALTDVTFTSLTTGDLPIYNSVSGDWENGAQSSLSINYSQLTGTLPKLDDLSAPDDNTDLNSTTLKHGLLKKLNSDATYYMDGTGNWSIPPASSGVNGGTVGGSSTQSGDAVETVFNIPHNLGVTPNGASVMPSSVDAFGDYTVDVDATNIIITYQSAPPSGTNNLQWYWLANTVIDGSSPQAMAKGSASKSGDASETTFTIAHGMSSIPVAAVVVPTSTDAMGSFTTTVDVTNITITYSVAPATGTDNLTYFWMAVDSSGGTAGAGEVNTASSLGTGSDIFKQKNSLDFEFRSIIGGTGIDATQNANDVTLDIDSTVATLTGSQTLTNKTLTTPIISTISNTGTITLPTATTTLVGRDTTDTLTNKTLTAPVIATITNTGTLTLPTSTDTLVGKATTDTLTNKTLTTPVITSISNSGTITIPTGPDTLVGRATTDTLTNKTLATPVISSISNSGTITLPTGTRTLVARDTTDTLTNKTLTAPIISTISNTGTITLPTATTTLTGHDTTDTLTNKSINITDNTVTTTSRATGDILKDNGTKYARFGIGTAYQVLAVNSGATDIAYTTLDKNHLSIVNNPIKMTRKYGFLVGTVTTPLTGTGSTVTASASQASATPNIDTTKGRYLTHVTGTVTGNNAGGRVSNLFQRAHNPYWSFRGRIVSTTNMRMYFGMSSDSGADPAASDTYADSKSIAMIGFRSTGDTNFKFIHNDGSATALYEDTGIAISNTIRTWEIYGDDAGGRFGWTVDGGAITWYTLQVPATGTNLGIIHQIQTNDSGVAKSFDLIALYTEFDSK